MSPMEQAEQTGVGQQIERKGAGKRPARVDLARLFDRLPPHSLEAEMSLLGSMILDPQVTGEVLQQIRSGESFYSQAHGLIFDSIVQTYDLHQSGDLVQLSESLKGKGVLEDVGGSEYLLELARSVPSSVNAPHYARIVGERSKLRRLIEAAGQIIYESYHAGDLGPDGAKETLDRAEKLIFDIAEDAGAYEAESLKELLLQTMDQLMDNEGRLITGLDTGYYELNEMTGGLQPGELIIVAARPSMGKTAFALNLAEQIALSGGAGGTPCPVAFFSLEMGRQAVTQRLLCAYAGVDSQRLRRNTLNAEEFQRLGSACGLLSETPLFIDDTPGLTVLQLRARARRMARMHGIQCIMIDYLQLLTAPGSSRESRQVEVSAISRGVKALARELNVPVVCLSQLNRGAEQREGHKPRMSDLRESGSIEQDADVITLLHREEYYHQADPMWAEENPDKVGLAELIVAKQRNGPTGVVNMVWDARTTRFRNYAGKAYTPPPAPKQEAPSAQEAAPFKPAPGGAFGGRTKSGPIENHRDGGGPDIDFEDDDLGDLPV
ncbi:MAG: replicative DNA helicase [Phycisphaerales bacterium]